MFHRRRRWFVPFVVLLLGYSTEFACDKKSPAEPTPVACTYTMTASREVFGADGGTATLTIATGAQCGWNATSNAAWIAVLSGAVGRGPGTVEIRVDANTTDASRSAEVRVANLTCVIRQDAAATACDYSMDPTSATFSSEGGTGTVAVRAAADCAWTASSSAPWVTITAGQSGSGAGTVTYRVASHLEAVERTATLTIAGQMFVIVQAPPAPCTPELSAGGTSIGPAGGAVGFDVRAPAGCRWSVRSEASWLAVTSPRDGDGVGSDRVELDVSQNTSPDSRTGTVRVGDTRFTVEQAGTAGCSYAVSPTEVELPFYGTTAGGRIELSANQGCPWTASTDAQWINLIGPTAGAGPATVRYDVALYTEAVTRRASIMIRWPTPTAGQNVWITQYGCAYVLTPSSVNVGASGSTGVVRVFASPTGGPTMLECPWTAEADVAWIRVLFATGVGEGSVQFEVLPNTGSQSRTGGIRIGYARFVVTQAGTSE